MPTVPSASAFAAPSLALCSTLPPRLPCPPSLPEGRSHKAPRPMATSLVHAVSSPIPRPSPQACAAFHPLASSPFLCLARFSSSHRLHGLDNGNRGVTGPEERLEDWVANLPSITAGETNFTVTFSWDVQKQGIPGAILVKNNHPAKFFLKTITSGDVLGRGDIVFIANS